MLETFKVKINEPNRGDTTWNCCPCVIGKIIDVYDKGSGDHYKVANTPYNIEVFKSIETQLVEEYGSPDTAEGYIERFSIRYSRCSRVMNKNSDARSLLQEDY